MDRDKQVVDKSQIKAEYLSGKTFSVTLNGQTKKITLGDVVRKDGEGWSDAVKRTVQEGLDKAFGENRVQVGMNGGAISFRLWTAKVRFPKAIPLPFMPKILPLERSCSARATHP